MRAMSLRHEESVARELEFLRRASVRFLVNHYGLPRYVVEGKLSRAQLLFNLIRDHARWVRRSDEGRQAR